MSTQELLDWERLYEWACAQPAGESVGRSCTCNFCPVARYLKAQTGQTWSVDSVYDPSIRTLNRTESLEVPSWMWSLIEQVDALTGNKHGPVTREQFLQVLMLVKESEGV